MKKLEEMLKKVDFSQETDLKEKLKARLFGKSKVLYFPVSENTIALDINGLENLSAAGYAVTEFEKSDES